MNHTLTPPRVLVALMLACLLSACGGTDDRAESPTTTAPDAGKTPVIRCAP